MDKINLAKALKFKSRIINEINDLEKTIKSNNSTVVGSNNDFDVKDLYEELNSQRELLRSLKIEIQKANMGMFDKMIKIGELKAHITFLKSINTESGKVPLSRYSQEIVEKEAVFSALDIKNKIKEAQNNINDLQDEIDDYNATTYIQFNLK